MSADEVQFVETLLAALEKSIGHLERSRALLQRGLADRPTALELMFEINEVRALPLYTDCFNVVNAVFNRERAKDEAALTHVSQ